MSAAFNEAERLVQENPMPPDIIELLDNLREDIDADEQDDFFWFYEAASLQARLATEED